MNSLFKLHGLAERRKRCRRGVLMPEFVLSVAVLITMLLAIVQYGIIMFNVNALNHVARETARYAAVHAAESTSDDAATDPVSIRGELSHLCSVSPLNYNYILNTASTASPSLVSNPNDPGVATTYTERAYGNLLTITIQYNMAKVVFFKPAVAGLSNWGTYTVYSTTMIDIPQVQ
ncbi:MAG: TadE/TadG family type IV pilus assembly protein [Capsulimonadaceae bacterium]